jgi:hypothetical protein
MVGVHAVGVISLVGLLIHVEVQASDGGQSLSELTVMLLWKGLTHSSFCHPLTTATKLRCLSVLSRACERSLKWLNVHTRTCLPRNCGCSEEQRNICSLYRVASHTVLPAILCSFLCTTAVRKISVTLFVEQDYFYCMNLSFVCVHVVCVWVLIFIIFIFYPLIFCY